MPRKQYRVIIARRKKPVSNTKLRQWFRQYNEQYFAGDLPACQVEYASIDGYGVTRFAKQDDGRTLIQISRKLAGSEMLARMTLLHEMTHVKLWEHHLEGFARPCEFTAHGPVFDYEMLRLAKLGAMDGLW